MSSSGRARVWNWAATVALVALGLMGAEPGGTVQRRAALVDYRVVNGAIPLPLTEQPGDPERGRRLVLDRQGGDCIICHLMPLPQRRFHGTFGPSLDGVGSRYTAAELRLRIVDARAINPQSVMPAYYKVEGLHRVLERYRGQPILTAQQVEDVVAYLMTLRAD